MKIKTLSDDTDWMYLCTQDNDVYIYKHTVFIWEEQFWFFTVLVYSYYLVLSIVFMHIHTAKKLHKRAGYVVYEL